MLMFLVILGLALIVETVLTAPIVVFGRRRVTWRSWELLALVLPFCIYTLGMCLFHDLDKGIGNVIEPFFLSLGAPAAALVRVAVGRSIDETICGGLLIIALCLAGTFVLFFTPNLGGSLG